MCSSVADAGVSTQIASRKAAPMIRVLFVLLAVLGGSGLVLYVAMWIIVPNES
jgi:hypothetical protein